jgi:hypothetical protein
LSETSAVILALWLLLLIRNNAAILPLFIHCIFLICFNLFNANFPIFCITSIALFQAAQININISSELRYALWLLGCIYLLGAIDELLYYHVISYAGVYLSFMPYIIIAIDSYIAAVIFKDGGRNIAGILSSVRSLVNNWRFRLQLLLSSKANN